MLGKIASLTHVIDARRRWRGRRSCRRLTAGDGSDISHTGVLTLPVGHVTTSHLEEYIFAQDGTGAADSGVVLIDRHPGSGRAVELLLPPGRGACSVVTTRSSAATSTTWWTEATATTSSSALGLHLHPRRDRAVLSRISALTELRGLSVRRTGLVTLDDGTFMPRAFVLGLSAIRCAGAIDASGGPPRPRPASSCSQPRRSSSKAAPSPPALQNDSVSAASGKFWRHPQVRRLHAAGRPRPHRRREQGRDEVAVTQRGVEKKPRELVK